MQMNEDIVDGEIHPLDICRRRGRFGFLQRIARFGDPLRFSAGRFQEFDARRCCVIVDPEFARGQDYDTSDVFFTS